MTRNRRCFSLTSIVFSARSGQEQKCSVNLETPVLLHGFTVYVSSNTTTNCVFRVRRFLVGTFIALEDCMFGGTGLSRFTFQESVSAFPGIRCVAEIEIKTQLGPDDQVAVWGDVYGTPVNETEGQNGKND